MDAFTSTSAITATVILLLLHTLSFLFMAGIVIQFFRVRRKRISFFSVLGNKGTYALRDGTVILWVYVLVTIVIIAVSTFSFFFSIPFLS